MLKLSDLSYFLMCGILVKGFRDCYFKTCGQSNKCATKCFKVVVKFTYDFTLLWN